MTEPSDRTIVMTGDGSQTVMSSRFSQHYHSTFGAVTESMHVFIGEGFNRAMTVFLPSSPEKTLTPMDSWQVGTTALNILEIGFGTGLNGWLTLIEAEKRKTPVHYTTIEAYPLSETLWKNLDYDGIGAGLVDPSLFLRLHESDEHEPAAITGYFTLEKQCRDLNDCTFPRTTFHLVYFDAFDPATQPELWTTEVFSKIFQSMVDGGILVTYSARGSVKRALREAGFIVERLPGPPGKRHIIRAVKPAG